MSENRKQYKYMPQLREQDDKINKEVNKELIREHTRNKSQSKQNFNYNNWKSKRKAERYIGEYHFGKRNKKRGID